MKTHWSAAFLCLEPEVTMKVLLLLASCFLLPAFGFCLLPSAATPYTRSTVGLTLGPPAYCARILAPTLDAQYNTGGL
jgi:hypothetical protein